MSLINRKKPFGIRVELPKHDPMSAPHLLGNDWAGVRWYETAEQRDEALLSMARQPAYYRKGDKPSIRLTKVDPD